MKRVLGRLRSTRGYTLIELLTAMTILAIIIGSLAGVFVSSSNAQIEANRRFQAQQNARLALERMRREVHCASDVTSGTGSWPTSHVILTEPTGCPGAPAVTWCTRSLGATRWGVYRIAGASATCTGGTEYADFVTVANTFNLPAVAAGRLARLEVDFPVDLTPHDALSAWRLTDSLVLRNDTR